MKRNVFRLRWSKSLGQWFIRWPDGVPTYFIEWARTKKQWVEEAAIIARDDKPSQLVVHNKDGSISFERTYPRSSDPKRHKG